jgi:50S ribosomal subunit-associated GTPase HflX
MNKILREIDVNGDVIVCANKIDVLGDDELKEALGAIGDSCIGAPLVAISALTGENLEELFGIVASKIRETKCATVRAGGLARRTDAAGDSGVDGGGLA